MFLLRSEEKLLEVATYRRPDQETGERMTARLGLLSDTHLPKPGGLPPAMLRAFEGVDAILHAGDVTSLEELAPLHRIAPVYLVMGNNDPAELANRFGWRRALRWRDWRIGLVHGDVGPRRTTPLNAFEAFREPPPRWEDIVARSAPSSAGAPSVSMAVAADVPEGRPWGWRLPLTAPPREEAAPHTWTRRGAPPPVSRGELGRVFDCIVFGHSHQPHCEMHEGVLLVNPGSPTERRREPRASFATMEAFSTGLEVRFFYF